MSTKMNERYKSLDVFNRGSNILSVEAYGTDSDEVSYFETTNTGVVLSLKDTKAVIEQLQYIVERYEEKNPQPTNDVILDALGTGAVIVINEETIPWVKLSDSRWTWDGRRSEGSSFFDVDSYKIHVLSGGVE